MRPRALLLLFAVSIPAVAASLAPGCSDAVTTTSSTSSSSGSTSHASSSTSGMGGSSSSVSSTSAGTGGHKPDGGNFKWCDKPGSLRYTANGTMKIPGGDPNESDLSFLHVPAGYCVHWFTKIGNPRQMRFAPGGELFVASPTQSTTGGGPNGQAAVVVFPDDDGDGYADKPVTFLSNLPATQGILFTKDHFYWQDSTKINRVAYAKGDRTPKGAPEQVADIQIWVSGLHWPKPMDIADDGTIYVGNGSDQGEACAAPMMQPFHGGILKLDGTMGGAIVARGFRNPIALRCERGHNLCFAAELAKDYSAQEGGREKLVPIHQGDDWGYPCCATQNHPYQGVVADCSKVQPDTDSFLIGDTPFGFDFERGVWNAPYAGSVFVALHGAFGTWVGARVVALEVDPSTGIPKAGSNINGQDSGALTDFLTGWDDGSLTHGRPAALEFSDDGRMFVANDTNGDIFWVAPITM